MTERQLQFRVGLLAIVAAVIGAVMIFQFSEIRSYWDKHYPLAIHYQSAEGVYVSTPVRLNGLTIGAVREVALDDKQGGVLVVVDIREKFRLRADTQARLTRSLLGDSTIEFSPGSSRNYLELGTRLEGITSTDILDIVNQMNRQLSTTMHSFQQTSLEWQKVAQNFNGLMETNRGNLDAIVERTAIAMEEFAATMRGMNETLSNANSIVGDPTIQEKLRESMAALPALVEDTRKTVAGVHQAVKAAESSLSHVSQITGPLAKRSVNIADNLDQTLTNMRSLTEQLDQFAQTVTKGDGSIQKLATDPYLYRNLNHAAESLAILLKNLDPVVRDLAIFSDKIARHPEIMGVGGAIRGSSGIKEAAPPERRARESGYQNPNGPRRR